MTAVGVVLLALSSLIWRLFSNYFSAEASFAEKAAVLIGLMGAALTLGGASIFLWEHMP